MRLAFLGTGAAFSTERYNGAVVVDGRILLDGGAPLLPHMARLDIDPAAIQTVFLTHFDGDHMLGLPPFMIRRAFVPSAPLTIVGPAGVEEVLESLFRLSWGSNWSEGPAFGARSGHTYEEGRERGEVNGVAYEAVRLDHGGPATATGYRLRMPDGRLLAYAGDTQMTPPLERLVEGAAVVITEATGPGRPVAHTGWEEAEALAGRHPGTRFLFNHVYAGSPSRAVKDLEIVDV